MEVILREDIDKLGQRGEVVKVAAGYARNFLLPQRLAVAATESNKKIVEQERQAHLRREAKESGRRQRSGQADGVGGSDHRAEGRRERSAVRLGDVAATSRWRSKSWATPSIARKVHLDEPIKTLGDYKVRVRLHREVSVEIPVHVVREE